MSRLRSTLGGLAFIAAALVALGLGGAMLVARFEGGRPRSIILLAACVATGVGLAVLGVRTLRAPASPGITDYRHMRRLFGGALGLLLVIGVVLDALVPESYGLVGPYRGAALSAAGLGEPRFLGEPACVDCHEKQVRLHDKDAHTRVPCESCHGSGRAHADFHRSAAGLPVVPAAAKMLVRKEREWCLRCHEADPARPGAFPQIVWSEHMRVSGLGGEGDDNATRTLPCGTCHDPHEPLFMDRDLRTARLHPLIHRCEDCHGRMSPEQVLAGPPEKHPVTFTCNYCHGTISEELTRSPHKSLDCTTCHVFFNESPFAGRIIRDADPRFCLLCHARADYRRPDGPKTIRWPSHRESMKRDAADTRQQCVECHRPALHYPAPPKVEVDVDALFDDAPATPAKPDDKETTP